MSAELRLRIGSRTCPVRLGAGAAGELAAVWQPAWRSAAIVGDANVLALYGEALAQQARALSDRVVTAELPPGEAHKTRETKAALEDALLAAGLDRGVCVVAVGGGVSLDVAGFVAATYLRGVPHVNVPTSLLAQVDAAIGGKTGVNTPHGKNLIGAFHQPAAVLIDPELLATLPAEEWPNGLAEMVKHAVIADVSLFEWIEAHVDRLAGPTVLDPHPLRRCVEIKAEIVSRDEREAGLRSVLNFGHTVGHALEAATGHAIGHGRAVAIGMVVEGAVARDACGLPPVAFSRLCHVLTELGIGPGTRPGVPFDALAPFLVADKKRRGDALRLALPRAPGQMAGAADGFTVPVALAALRRAWEETA